MKLNTESFVEHQCFGEEEVRAPGAARTQLMVPGGTTTSWGSTCTTSCVK
ncbi:MAG TPA: hypothetical protein VK486_14475 [Thermoleophilaceae bacterium]|nr:hypothetical protein [Thermoleophilaceae bacterium]